MLLSKLKSFFSWWGEGLYLGLPKSLRRLFCAEQPRLSLQLIDDNRLAVFWRNDGKQKSCGVFDLDRGAFDFDRVAKKCARRRKYLLELLLDKHQMLYLQHRFPEAVRDDIKQVVGYQLDRLTPFSASAAYYDAQIVSRDKFKKEVIADIRVAPKTLVDKLFAQLQAVGVPKIAVVADADSHTHLTLGALTDQAAGQTTLSRVPLFFFLLALSASLIVPVLYKQRRVDQIEAALSQVREGSVKQLEIRDKLLAAEDALAFLKERRRTSPVVLEVVERLSAEIPKHTWLERLELEGQQIQLRGESKKALTLIDTLEESAYFKRASFKSPVTRSRESGKDKFHVQAWVEMPGE